MTPENGVKIGQVTGRFMYSEKNTPFLSPEDVPPAMEFLRIRVFLDIREPLCTQYLVKRTGLSDIWIQVRYENLGVFCFKCGLIGYYLYACNHPRGLGTTKYNSLLSALPCSDAPLIRFSKISTMLKESSDSEHEASDKGKGSEEEIEESPDKMFDSHENFSTRVPQMNTKLEKSSDLGQGILSEIDKVSEKKDSEEQSNYQMFNATEKPSPRVFRKFKTKPREEVQEKKIENEKKEHEKEKNNKEESSDKMFNANDNFVARSGMQMLVMNALVTMVMTLKFAMMHRQVAEDTASKEDHGKFENWKWLLENWKMTVLFILHIWCGCSFGCSEFMVRQRFRKVGGSQISSEDVLNFYLFQLSYVFK